MQPQPIETAPKDREILVYGLWGWENVEHDLEKGWRVAIWSEYVGEYDEETYQRSGGFSSVTEHPYKDYSLGILWCELPTVEA